MKGSSVNTNRAPDSRKDARNVGARSTIRCAVATSPPPRSCKVWRGRGRLLAPGRGARLPDRTYRSVADEHALNYYPLQWRGRTGITPVSVSRVRYVRLSRECYPGWCSSASAAARRDLRRARSASYCARSSAVAMVPWSRRASSCAIACSNSSVAAAWAVRDRNASAGTRRRRVAYAIAPIIAAAQTTAITTK